MKWKATRAYLKKLQRRRRRVAPTRPRASIPRNSGEIFEYDIYTQTGMFEDDFAHLFQRIKPSLTLPRRRGGTRRISTSLAPHMRLLLVLQFLRQHVSYSVLSQMYKISRAQVSREIWHVMPKLYLLLDEIRMPEHFDPDPFEGVVGAIDCSSHFRTRIHPRQAEYYRYDKHGFFLTAQAVVDLRGVLLNVQLGLGHNNDKGMFNLTGMGDYLHEHNICLLADGGYSSERLITPDDGFPTSWNNTQKGKRSVIEVALGMVKLFRFAAERVRVSPELQEISLLCCYQLTNLVLKEFPLRLQ